MTISTYTELQDAIGNFMTNDDYKSSGTEAGATKDFIALVESDLNSNPDFLLSFMESRVTDAMTASDRYLGVPADLKQVRRVVITGTDPDTVLEYVPAEEFSQRFALAAVGKPTKYTLIGDEFEFGSTPDSAYAIEIGYYAKLVTTGPTNKPSDQKPLSDTNTANWILTNQPDIYLFGALGMASYFAQAIGELKGYRDLYQRAVQKTIAAERKRSVPRAGKRARTMGGTP